MTFEEVHKRHYTYHLQSAGNTVPAAKLSTQLLPELLLSNPDDRQTDSTAHSPTTARVGTMLPKIAD